MRIKCYKVVMCGARDWHNAVPIKRELRRLVKQSGVDGLIIIHGGAPGADTLAGILAEEMSIHVARVDALWATRHRSAGPQRNTAMLALAPDEVIGFHQDLTKSRGTKDMINQARKAVWPPKVKVVSA